MHISSSTPMKINKKRRVGKDITIGYVEEDR